MSFSQCTVCPLFDCALQQLVISDNRLSPAVVIISTKEISRDGKMLSQAQSDPSIT